MKAKKKPMQTLAATDLPGLGSRTPGTTLLKLAPPPEKPSCRMIEGDPPQMARELIRLLREEAKVI
jgi:electron transfer flavoprotein beta subunit